MLGEEDELDEEDEEVEKKADEYLEGAADTKQAVERFLLDRDIFDVRKSDVLLKAERLKKLNEAGISLDFVETSLNQNNQASLEDVKVEDKPVVFKKRVPKVTQM
jgi:hypothetical protein